MEPNHTTEIEMAHLVDDQATINIPEISEASVEQNPMAFHPPLSSPFHVDENPNVQVTENPLERSIKHKLSELPNENDQVPHSFLIFRISYDMRKRNKMYLEPSLVSIGPYYRRRENLRAMEKVKVRCLRDYLARSPSVSVENLIEKMKAFESRARQFYSENIELSSDEFVEMLLLDTCFIAEVFIRFDDLSIMTLLGNVTNHIIVCSDMFKIENQIPFFVLESILDISRVTSCFRDFFFMAPNPTQATRPSQIAHLAHLFYQFHIPLDKPPYESNAKSSTVTIKLNRLLLSIKHMFISQNSTKESVRMIPSASELYEAGITFNKKQSPLSLFNITFDKGIIEMPPILVDMLHKTLLVNLLAFEQNKFQGVAHISLSSYLYLMQYIVRTSKDMAVLRKCGIISSSEPNEEDSVLFFNHLSDLNCISQETNIFNELFRDIDEYYKGSWHQYRAKLKRDYFNSPWSIISLGAGVILLVLTFLQTIYGIKSYKPS